MMFDVFTQESTQYTEYKVYYIILYVVGFPPIFAHIVCEQDKPMCIYICFILSELFRTPNSSSPDISSLLHFDSTKVFSYWSVKHYLCSFPLRKENIPWFFFYLIIVNSLYEDSFNLCTQRLMSCPFFNFLVPGVI